MPFPAGEFDAFRQQLWQLYLEESLSLLIGKDHHSIIGLQAERKQETKPPVVFATRVELDQGVIFAPETACNKTAQSEVMRPGGGVLQEQVLELLMAAGFEHCESLGSRKSEKAPC